MQGVCGHGQRRDADGTVRPEVEAFDSAERGHVLILLADWPLQPVELDRARFIGQVTWRNVITPEGIDSAKQSNGERSG
jgi:hypothetical protein